MADLIKWKSNGVRKLAKCYYKFEWWRYLDFSLFKLDI